MNDDARDLISAMLAIAYAVLVFGELYITSRSTELPAISICRRRSMRYLLRTSPPRQRGLCRQPHCPGDATRMHHAAALALALRHVPRFNTRMPRAYPLTISERPNCWHI